MRFGSVLDVQVNWYHAIPMSHKQEGYAFVSFANQAAYESILMNPTHVVDGITLVCTASNQTRRAMQPSSSSALPPTITLSSRPTRSAPLNYGSSSIAHAQIPVTNAPPRTPSQFLIEQLNPFPLHSMPPQSPFHR